ncbi:MAG: tripartite tricarboxylate transporter substrate binding protein [Pseudomonadota bacterium]
MIRISIFLSVALALPLAVHGQSWPTKPIRYIVPFAPGGTTDILGRLVGKGLSEALGQQVIVDNRPGQAGSLGAAELARATADGHTLGGGTISSHAINATLYPKLPYDPLRDFVPITMLATQPNMLIIHSTLPAKNVKEFIALARARPGQLNFGSAGSGTSQHISGEMFKAITGVQMQHVPYKGSGQMIPDLLAGYVELSFENIATAHPHAKTGKLRALAVTSSKRSFVAPEVPTMQEAGVAGYDISSWQAMFAPAGVPREIASRLNVEVNKILRSTATQKTFTDLGLEAAGGAADDLAAVIRNDIPRLGRIVRASGAKVD